MPVLISTPQTTLSRVKMVVRDDFVYAATVYVVVAAVLTLAHLTSIDLPHVKEQRQSHDEIIKGATVKPYNIRVLQPCLVQAMMNVLPERHKARAFLGGYAAIRFLSLLTTFVVAEAYLRRFASRDTARIFVLLIAAIVPLTYYNYFYQPTSVLDLAFFAVGLAWIVAGKSWRIVPLVAIATANRNTGVFIAAAYAVYHLDDLWSGDRQALKKSFAVSATAGAAWLGMVMLLETIYPAHGWVNPPSEYLRYNARTPAVWIFTGLVWWPLIVGGVLGWNRVDSRFQRLVLLWMPVYIAIHVLMARVDEVRYWLPLYLVVGPFCVRAYEQASADPMPDARLL